MEKHLEVERSIYKKYRKEIWNRFVEGVKTYELIQEGDKVCVCLSGGKDSMLLAKCMQHLQKYSDFPFGLEFLVLDPGYADFNRAKIIENAKLLDVPIHIFDANIFNYVAKQNGSPCYLCARMRRGYLYKYAAELGCNKIALGHHFDDVIETILLSMFYGAEIKTMMPKLKSTSHPGMELIRPLYLVKEQSIKSWVRYNDLAFIRCACRFEEMCERGEKDEKKSKRREMKELVSQLRKTNSNVDMNIFRSMEHVNLGQVIAWQKNGECRSFLDDYDVIPADTPCGTDDL